MPFYGQVNEYLNTIPIVAETRGIVRKRQASLFIEKYGNKKIRTVKESTSDDDKSNFIDEEEQESGGGIEITKNYGLLLNGENLRSTINNWCKSTKYVADVHKQEYVFFIILSRVV